MATTNSSNIEQIEFMGLNNKHQFPVKTVKKTVIPDTRNQIKQKFQINMNIKSEIIEQKNPIEESPLKSLRSVPEEEMNQNEY